jgi:nitrogen fixation protein
LGDVLAAGVQDDGLGGHGVSLGDAWLAVFKKLAEVCPLPVIGSNPFFRVV